MKYYILLPTEALLLSLLDENPIYKDESSYYRYKCNYNLNKKSSPKRL